MQSLAAYCFEAAVDDPRGRLDVIDQLTKSWLRKKGAEDPDARDGGFVSKTGDGVGQFSRQLIESSIGSLREVELIETTDTGAMFTTRMQVVKAGSRIVVYAALSATPGDSRVTPVRLYPRCPLVIRSILEHFADWKFADQAVPLSQAFDATTPEKAKILCDDLRSSDRRLPIVVVSSDEDEAVWPDLQDQIAKHLIGLAGTAFVSAESSWVLTDELGQRNSCYLGAVRLYWPGKRRDNSLAGINWVASKLALFGTDEGGKNRFLAALRREIMSVAALTMVPPALAREIRNSAERKRLQSLKQEALDQELASIIDENSMLSSELERANSIIQSLQWKIAHAEYLQRSVGAVSDDDLDASPEDEQERDAPKAGDVRYYKKIGSGGGVDTLIQTKPCNHRESNWKPAFKGDQAEKGLLKLEGRNDWRSIAHCSACTGGGRWKVSW